jgi:euchromatic histone-lysine N-methyltransferase
VYVYDGVYRVIESWIDVGKSSIGVYKFKLRMIDNKATMDSLVLKELFMFRRDP